MKIDYYNLNTRVREYKYIRYSIVKISQQWLTSNNRVSNSFKIYLYTDVAMTLLMTDLV